MTWSPFTLHLRIVPNNPQRRFEYWRDMQKIAYLAHQALSSISSINIVQPSGGQMSSFGRLGGMVPGLAAKPQFGETPAQLMVTGFYQTELPNSQPHPEKMLLHTGQALSGPGSAPWSAGPQSAVDAQVAALKAEIETALDAGLPETAQYSVFRLEYKGIVYGDRGYHFPL